jgi:hypothetical protein
MITRNRLLLFAKCIPARLLLRHAAKLIYGQMYFMLAYARPWSSIKGYLSFVAELPGIMPMRRHMLQQTALTIDQINALLHVRPPGPSLRGLLSGYMAKVMRR